MPNSSEYNKNYYQKNKEHMKKQHKEYNRKNKERLKEHHKEYYQKYKDSLKKHKQTDPQLTIWRRAKYNAKVKKIEFNLLKEDIHIPEVCPYLGIKLSAVAEQRTHNSPSIDRIDSTKGYIRGNIQIISDFANRMKQDATVEQLVSFARNVIKLHDR